MVNRASGKTPATSIIMAVRDEGEAIEATLEALAAQTWEPDAFEVVIADGCSTDTTLEKIQAFAREQKARGLEVIILENSGLTAATGLNHALEIARGETVVRVDGHTRIEPDYLACVHQALEESGADCVGGLQVPEGKGVWGRAYALVTAGISGSGGASFRSGSKAGPADTVYLGAWPRATFEKYGNFDTSLERNQDDEHNMRILDGGGSVYLDPAIRSTYQPRESAGALARQYLGYGLWKPAVLFRHPLRIRLRHVVPSFLVCLALSAVLIPQTAVLFVAYVALLLVISLLKATRSKDVAMASTIFSTLLIMHFAYGIGFIFGLPRIPLSFLAQGSSGTSQLGDQRD